MRRNIIALIAGIMLIVSAAPTNAAASVTVGGSCKLSANWTVRVSVKYYNTSGSPSRGSAAYAVMVSPAALHHTNSWWGAYDTSGRIIRDGYTFRVAEGTHTYRADIKTANVREVWINPAGGESACLAYNNLAILRSRN